MKITSSAQKQRHLFSLFLLFAATATLLFSKNTIAFAAATKFTKFNSDPSIIPPIFDELLDSDAKLRELDITNFVVLVVFDGRIIFEKGYGFIDLNRKTAANPRKSIYAIGGLSKTFVGTAALQLRERSLLNITEDVNSYVPGIVSDTIVGNERGDSFGWRPRQKTREAVTPFHLLTHTAGLDERIAGISLDKHDEFRTLKYYVQKNMPPRIRQPGQRISTLDNYGTALLGLLVEQLTDETYFHYLYEHILHPLNMTKTYAFFSDEMEREKHFAQPIVYSNRDDAYKNVVNFGQHMTIYPVSGMFSTGLDLARYMITLLNDGYCPETEVRLLHEETVRAMFSRQFTHHDSLLGVGMSWYEGNFYDFPYFEAKGSLEPYFTAMQLFKDENVGLVMLQVGDNEDIFSILKSRFIATTMVSTDYCTENGGSLDEVSMECIKTVPLTSITPITQDYEQRWTGYEGCFVSSNYEHTTWYKIQFLAHLPYCIKREGPILRLLHAYAGLALYEVEQDVFKFGVLNGANSLNISLTDDKLATFLMSKKNSNAPSADNHALFMAVNQRIFEYYEHTAISIGFQLFFFAFAFMQVVGGAFLVFGFCSLDYVNLRKELNLSRGRALGGLLEESDSQLNSDVDETTALRGTAAGTKGSGAVAGTTGHHHRHHDRHNLRSKRAIITVITTVSTFVTVTLVYMTTGFNLLNLLMMGIVVFRLDTKSLLLPHNDVEETVAVLMPLFSTICMTLIPVSLIGMCCARLWKGQVRKDRAGMVFAVALAGSAVLTIAVNVTYYVFIAYFNLYGKFFIV